MEIRAYSTYDLKTVTALARLTMFKRVDHKKRMKTFGILDIVLLAAVVIEIILFGPKASLILMLAVLVFATLLYSYRYFWFPRRRYKASGKLADIKNEFVFYADEFSVSSDHAGCNGECTVKYSILYKVMETSEYFFLFQNKLGVYIVDKSTIQGGTAEDIRKKLLPILEKQYIICKY